MIEPIESNFLWVGTFTSSVSFPDTSPGCYPNCGQETGLCERPSGNRFEAPSFSSSSILAFWNTLLLVVLQRTSNDGHTPLGRGLRLTEAGVGGGGFGGLGRSLFKSFLVPRLHKNRLLARICHWPLQPTATTKLQFKDNCGHSDINLLES